MYIIKLDAIDSTNSYLKEMAAVKMPKDYTVVVSDMQTKGRGQMGTNWQSEDGKNLTFSVFRRIEGHNVEDQFYISMAVSLSLCAALRTFQVPKLTVKWPNDILSANKKICGILIENILRNNKLVGCIIGIGLNVNQRFFNDLPNASSLYVLTGILYNKDELLSEILAKLRWYLDKLKDRDYESITKDYKSKMFRLNKPSTFKDEHGKQFSGIIKGVNEQGKLQVWVEDEEIKLYGSKEITLLY